MSKEDATNAEGVFSVRFGAKGTPDRDALERLAEIGAQAKPVPANRNQMIRLAVREYVERYGGNSEAQSASGRAAKGKGAAKK